MSLAMISSPVSNYTKSAKTLATCGALIDSLPLKDGSAVSLLVLQALELESLELRDSLSLREPRTVADICRLPGSLDRRQ